MTNEEQRMTTSMMHGIGSLSDKEREEIVMLIIEAITSKWEEDVDREVDDGGIKSIEFCLMRYPPLQRYPEYIVDHVLEVDVYRAGILDMILGRPVLLSGRNKATVII